MGLHLTRYWECEPSIRLKVPNGMEGRRKKKGLAYANCFECTFWAQSGTIMSGTSGITQKRKSVYDENASVLLPNVVRSWTAHACLLMLYCMGEFQMQLGDEKDKKSRNETKIIKIIEDADKYWSLQQKQKCTFGARRIFHSCETVPYIVIRQFSTKYESCSQLNAMAVPILLQNKKLV